jgi:hypothetical protein
MKSLWHHKPEDEYVVITNHVISISTTEPQERGLQPTKRTCLLPSHQHDYIPMDNASRDLSGINRGTNSSQPVPLYGSPRGQLGARPPSAVLSIAESAWRWKRNLSCNVLCSD